MNLDSLPRYPGGPLKRTPEGLLLEDLEALTDWAICAAIPDAAEEAVAVAIPNDLIFSLEIPKEFGERWSECLSRCRSELLEHDEGTRIDLLFVAARLVEYGRRHAPLQAWLKAREMPWRDTYKYQIEDPQARHLDVFYIPFELLIGTSFKDFPDSGDLFRVQALAWFFDASELQRSSNPKAFDLLFEVAEALRICGEDELWSDAAREERQLAASNLAKKGASARHAHSNKKAEELRAWWLDNRTRFKSLDQAAEEASEKFDCAFRTARDHIGLANRELRSAGKA